MSSTLRRRAPLVSAACVCVLLLTGCGSDDSATPGLSPAPSTPTTTITPDASSTPTTRPTSTPSRTAKPSSAPTSAAPTDDENGELAGQVIIEYPGSPLRRNGSTKPNESVRDLQIRLGEVGYPVKVTGIFDAQTERAVIRFQRDDGLTPDGIVGPATWAALFTFEGGQVADG